VSASGETVPVQLRSGVDYAGDRGWARLADRLARTHVPRATATFGWTHCEPGWSWHPDLDDYDLWFVLAGRGRAALHGAEVDFGAGSMFVLRPGDRGTFRQDPRHRLFVAYCHFHFVDPRDGRPRPMPDDLLPARWLPRADLARLGGLMHRLVTIRRDRHPIRGWESSAALAAVLSEVYVQDCRLAGHPAALLDSRVQDVLDFVAVNLHRRPSLGEIAAVVSLSPGRVSKLFATQVGMSLREYAVSARLDRARHLLAETSMTVGQIAHALGYHDPFLLSRQFTRRFGVAPSRYRAGATTEADR
jgi:AraC-like DNA-binding protein/mannose-6-phosphate isomerase-like protein (cupin superfamily)